MDKEPLTPYVDVSSGTSTPCPIPGIDVPQEIPNTMTTVTVVVVIVVIIRAFTSFVTAVKA